MTLAFRVQDPLLFAPADTQRHSALAQRLPRQHCLHVDTPLLLIGPPAFWTTRGRVRRQAATATCAVVGCRRKANIAKYFTFRSYSRRQTPTPVYMYNEATAHIPPRKHNRRYTLCAYTLRAAPIEALSSMCWSAARMQQPSKSFGTTRSARFSPSLLFRHGNRAE